MVGPLTCMTDAESDQIDSLGDGFVEVLYAEPFGHTVVDGALVVCFFFKLHFVLGP